jgi:hypothetical protein
MAEQCGPGGGAVLLDGVSPGDRDLGMFEAEPGLWSHLCGAVTPGDDRD